VSSSTTEHQVPAPETASPTGFAAVRSSARRSVLRAWPAMAAYLAVRLIGTLVYALLSSGHGYAARGMFVFVDSGWYQKIAERGYDTKISPNLSPFAFEPLYPGLMALGHAVTGLSVTAVGLTITWVAAAACSWALYEIGRLLRDARTGLLFAVLWALMPSAVIQASLYADTLAICLSAWALYALLRRSWLTAGVLACLAGATRPTADAIVLTVCLAAVVDFARHRGWIGTVGGAGALGADSGAGTATGTGVSAAGAAADVGPVEDAGRVEDASRVKDAGRVENADRVKDVGPAGGAPTGDALAERPRAAFGWRPWAAFVIAPIGALGFLAYVAYRVGSISGYMSAQKKWGTGFGNAGQVFHRIRLGIEGSAHGYDNGQAHITTAVLLIVPILIVVMLFQRQRWEIVCYTLVVAAIVYTAIHDYTVVPREMLAGFPVLLAPAGWLARVRRPWIVWLVIVVLAVAAGWYAHFITVDGGPGYP
jgi:hypothetical protein